jgi:hypothetical protein
LSVVSVVDVLSHSVLFVCSDVIKDVTTDATIKKATDHANFTKDIAMVVEEIVHENGNKALESNIVVDMAENVVDQAVGQSGVENDDIHAADEKIVATADSRANIAYHHP